MMIIALTSKKQGGGGDGFWTNHVTVAVGHAVHLRLNARKDKAYNLVSVFENLPEMPGGFILTLRTKAQLNRGHPQSHCDAIDAAPSTRRRKEQRKRDSLGPVSGA